MGFGAPSGMISTNTAYTVQTAEKTDEVGSITEMKTYGGVEEKTEEYFSATPTDITNAATNGQTGSTSTGVVTSHTLNEVNTEYARETKVTRKPLAAPA